MEQKHEQPLASGQSEPVPAASRRVWQRPTLQRLHVSLDTAFIAGSGTDGDGSTGVGPQ
jgi:hypothetical protein